MVILLTKKNCPPCAVQKKALRDAGISYNEVDINDEAAWVYVHAYGIRSVPCVVVPKRRSKDGQAHIFPGTYPIGQIRAKMKQ